MKKIAVIANFSIKKRMVIEIPDDTTLDEYLYLESNGAFEGLSEAAASEFIPEISEYLVPENFEAEEDREIPAEDSEKVSEYILRKNME